MSADETVAYIQSQTACALIEAMGMKAENDHRILRNESVAYVHDDFERLIDRYGISHNGVMTLLQQAFR